MRSFFLLFLFWSLPACFLSAQMWNGTDTLYGNEWIQFDQPYLKILVAEDGLYRLSFEVLESWLPPTVAGNQLQLFYLGEEVPIFVSTDGPLQTGDFIAFWGQRHRNELDRFLFQDTQNYLHPDYSLFTDSSAYFLTWQVSASGLRYQTIPNELTNLPPPEPFFYHTLSRNFPNSHIKRSVKVASVFVKQSYFAEPEGFTTGFPATTLQTHSLLPEKPFLNGPPASLTVRFACQEGNHHQVVRVNGLPYVEDIFSGNQTRIHTFELPAADLDGALQVQCEGIFDANDKQAIGSMELHYPRQFDFSGYQSFCFSLDASSQPQYLEIENFDHGNLPPVLYDRTNALRLVTTLENGLVKILLPPSSEARKLILVHAATGSLPVTSVSPVSFIDYSQEDAEFILLYHEALASDGQGINWVEEYVQYRQFESPNAMPALSVEIRQLYDQFAYGIHRHPLSIRNFGHFVKKYWENPKYLFLVGKGREYPFIRSAAALQQSEGVDFFLPTFGTPASDNLLLSTNFTATPLFAIGRLAATSPDDVRIYLQKVRDFESLPNELDQTIEGKQWMKRLVHLGGGGPASEQNTIKNHLLEMESIIENSRLGGRVTSYFKTSTAPIEFSQAESLKDLINTGISIITFFGHSSPNSFDFNFDDPQGYDNFKKYFLLLSNGCFSGNCFTNTASIGERFVAAENRGAIAYWATSDYGFISALQKFGDTLYHHIGEASYGASIGQQIRSTIQALDHPQIIGERELAQQSLLQGDPSIRIHTAPGPDYTFDPASVLLDPGLLNVQLDSFDLRFSIENLGSHLPDTSFLLTVEQELPSGQRVQLVERKVPAPAFDQEWTLRLPLLGMESVGRNRLFMEVDAADEIAELPLEAEWNNALSIQGQPGFPFLVVSNDIVPLQPEAFAIIGSPAVELIAYTVDLFAPAQTYLFELDTTERFDSPQKTGTAITQSGGLVKWTPASDLVENTVYYWRVSPDSTAAGSYRWRSSSFIYLPDASPGWNQSHFFQYAKNAFLDTQLPETSRRLEYIEDVVDLKFQNCFLEFPEKIPRYYRGNVTMASYFPWMTDAVPAGVFIAVFDTVKVAPLWNDGSLSFGDDYGYPGFQAFAFRTQSTAERAEVIQFLENQVMPGQYVGLFTVQQNAGADYFPETWAADTIALGTSLFQVLEAQGATQISDLASLGSVPYTLFYRKDVPDYPVKELLTPPGERTQMNVAVEGNWFEGAMRSVLIGPSSRWETFQWQVSDLEAATDSIRIRVYAPVSDQTDTLLIENAPASPVDLQDLDASRFPFLRLEFFTQDETDRTSPQLDYWRVQYQELPEAALHPALSFSFPGDTLYQGAPFFCEVAIENISGQDMDSLLVRFLLKDAGNQIQLFEKRFRPLPAGDTLLASLNLDSRQWLGQYECTIEVNPDGDQPERSHANNVGVFSFWVEKDRRNPLLHITFDGIPILEGDLVSASPRILVSLQDENPYLSLADTSLFQLLLVHPDGWEQRAYFAQENVRFFPADSDKPGKKNKATVEFMPQFKKDGLYQLFVKAQDASGNPSGNLDLTASPAQYGYHDQISFRVVTESRLSNVLNYPNPFSTRTHFVYTLTGAEPPPFFRIQILTVSGRVVRELTQQDLGPLRIGTHQTDYAWDGTDQFGDRLANGVYLYRVLAQDASGKTIDHFATGTDRFFKKGFGKLVIIR